MSLSEKPIIFNHTLNGSFIYRHQDFELFLVHHEIKHHTFQAGAEPLRKQVWEDTMIYGKS
jgi:hypothetical protein